MYFLFFNTTIYVPGWSMFNGFRGKFRQGFFSRAVVKLVGSLLGTETLEVPNYFRSYNRGPSLFLQQFPNWNQKMMFTSNQNWLKELGLFCSISRNHKCLNMEELLYTQFLCNITLKYRIIVLHHRTNIQYSSLKKNSPLYHILIGKVPSYVY